MGRREIRHKAGSLYVPQHGVFLQVCLHSIPGLGDPECPATPLEI